MEEKTKKMGPTEEQVKILESKAKSLVISASAGSGKTYIVIEKLKKLICDLKVPVERLLVLTFTKVAAEEIKTRLTNAILSMEPSKKMLESLDALPLSDISTIDSFCEKIIKRNINKLEIDENFVILEEKSALKLKKVAFFATYQHFSQEEKEKFEDIYLGFKKDKRSIEECIYKIQDYFGAVEDEEDRFVYFEDVFNLNSKATDKLLSYFKECFKEARQVLDGLDTSSYTKSELEFVLKAYDIVGMNFDEDYFNTASTLAAFSLPVLLGRHKEEVKRPLGRVKEQLKKAYDIAKKYSFIPNGARREAEEGRLPRAILSFYKYYINIYSSLKLKRSGLDFADIEKLAKKLLADDEVKKGLQEKYDYIFIDEYQDTNRLQESILKPIAEGGYFTAVGDIKQGIYGFRNASMEIMLSDIEEFSSKEDGDALYLNGNFRTDDAILSFVNRVFEKVMTKESVGIDYKASSMLKGLKKFLPGSMKPVIVDILLKGENKKSEQACQEEETQTSEIYSLEDDYLAGDDSQRQEVDAIISRIEQALEGEIYDSKLGKMRAVEYNDIALLFRGRSSLMKELVRKLRGLSVPVSADLKEELIDDYQIALLNSLLKLTINFKDDVSVAAVMCSPFGNFSIDELASIREGGESGKSFWQLIDEADDEKVVEFKKMIAQFKFEIQIFGINKALCKLFNRYDYYGYLALLPNYHEKISNLNNLFKMIKAGGLDFSTAGVIAALEGSYEIRSGEGNANSISVLTIHATKGLEYPIVILCGCGESLNKAYTKSYLISNKYGLGCYLNDFESMTRVPSPAFLAGKLELENREFVDEIMIFYVAMTRAQNHLFIVGSAKEKELIFDNVRLANSYLKFIFFGLGENFTEQLFSQGNVQTENLEFNIIPCEEEKTEEDIVEEKLNDFDEENPFESQIRAYDEYLYPNLNECKISLKNSVSGVMNALKPYEEGDKGEVEDESFSHRVHSREEAIQTGNAYHEALKIVDFNDIESLEDLKNKESFLKENLSDGFFERLDLMLLFKNIMVIKSVTKDLKLVKEREFIMQSTPSELGLDSLNEELCLLNINIAEDKAQSEEIGIEQNSCEENQLIVQGIVDLFAMGDKLVLIDYKYSSERNERAIVERYQNQIKLYSLALEKAFGRAVDEKYLLSLKEGKLIKIDL